jgi:hypothetical protein
MLREPPSPKEEASANAVRAVASDRNALLHAPVPAKLARACGHCDVKRRREWWVASASYFR